ncbi:MAG TPA: bifunctional 5,10-methylenetetrahydrofolate dehydrogenase/5,10-methenyltetrahydrofolate cyclohydrolase [Thermomicrobiales bacterium]|nr:bifunctional 5,10-methylenetetrahydrofolate dehydrogenase/5,10-methenyltetrahydrofolate cyclohydrolase [Thermomicrobiales bacterium]
MPADGPEPVETYVLKGSRLAKRLRAEIAASQQHLLDVGGEPPRLATLIVGEDRAAIAYRSSIERTFARAEIDVLRAELPGDVSEQTFLEELRELNRDPQVTAVLVLMPLPAHLNPHLVLENLSPLKDVDGITPTNAGRLHLGLPSLRPSTPAGGLALLDHYGVTLEGARVTVVGRSNVVGRPLATLLTQRDATVTLCHSKTVDLDRETRRAEIVCVAAGHAGLISRDMVSRGTVVIDFGVNVTDEGKLTGDADFDGLMGIAGAITPVPGGTGPVTALTLAQNTMAAGFAALGGNLDYVDYALPDRLQQKINDATREGVEQPTAS